MIFGGGVLLPQRYTNNTTGPGSLHFDFLTGAPLDSRITFSRTTDATLVDATGRVTYAPNNLLLRSEEFDDAAWSKTNSTIAANVTTAPNGTLTADKHIPNNGATMGSGAAETRVQRSPTATLGVNYVFSIYAKAGEYDQVELALISTPSVSAVFSLTSGTVVSGTGASITPVGDGWYRCAIITTASATGTLAVRWSAKSSTVSVGDGVSGIFAWGAQLEEVTYQTTPGTYNSTSPPNLFGFTEEFENAAWVKGNSTVTVNATNAPNGTTTADKLVENTATGAHQITLQTAFVSGAPYTWSFYVKAAERSVVRVLFPAAAFTSNLTANFDLATGAWRTGSPTPSPALTLASQDAGNGWYRISATATATASLNQTILLLMVNTPSGTGNYTGDGTSGLFIWGAQLSNSASVDPYVYNPGAAPTSTAYYGSRFDYNPATLAPRGLLIEEQRVNLALYSDQFDNPSWSKAAGSVTANSVTSPDGTTNADTFVADTSTTFHTLSYYAPASGAAGVSYTTTVYLKAAANTFFRVQNDASGFGSQGGQFDLTAVTASAVNSATAASITSVGNGWFRCSVTSTSTGAFTAVGLKIFPTNAGGNGSIAGTGTASFFVWGAQTELGAFATSYIPTVASTVTRAADVAVMTGANFSSWYNQSEGTVVVECNQVVGANSTSIAYAISDNTFNNSQYALYTGGNTFRASNLVVGGVGQPNLISSFSVANVAVPIKDAFAYAVDNFGESLGGQTTRTDSLGIVNTASNRMYIGSSWSGTGNYTNGHIRSITYYATRLTNAQLQALTS